MLEDEIKKIIDEYSDITKKHGLYSYEAANFVKQYENNIEVEDYLRFARQMLRKIKEVLKEDLGTIEDKVTYYEDGKTNLGMGEDLDENDLNNF